jgi:hypothetical protein
VHLGVLYFLLCEVTEAQEAGKNAMCVGARQVSTCKGRLGMRWHQLVPDVFVDRVPRRTSRQVTTRVDSLAIDKPRRFDQFNVMRCHAGVIRVVRTTKLQGKANVTRS